MESSGKPPRSTLNITPNTSFISSSTSFSSLPSSSTSPPSSHTSPITSPPPPHRQGIAMSPCAACKILRRHCSVEKCVLAPYFPPTDPLKFTIPHRVFGTSNIIKFLQDLPESQRADAVSSMVYEANARLSDPVYGSAGAVCQLQRQVNELQAKLAKAQAEMITIQHQKSNLLALFSMDDALSDDQDQTMISFEQKVHDDHMNQTVTYDELYEIGNCVYTCFDNNLESVWA